MSRRRVRTARLDLLVRLFAVLVLGVALVRSGGVWPVVLAVLLVLSLAAVSSRRGGRRRPRRRR